MRSVDSFEFRAETKVNHVNGFALTESQIKWLNESTFGQWETDVVFCFTPHSVSLYAFRI